MTRRLIVALTAVVAMFWLLAAALGALVMKDEFDEIFDSALKETAGRLTPLIVDDISLRREQQPPRQLDPVPLSEEDNYITFQVRDATGKVLLHSHDVTAAAFDAPLKPGFHDTPEFRIFTVAAAGDTIFVQVADSRWHRQEAVVEGALALMLPLLILVPASILAIRLIVRRMLLPVDTLRQTIASKDSGNMAPLSDAYLPRELQPIAHSVNKLLGRLRSALEAEREFTANSAHELRTPIAGALAQTQRLMEIVNSDEARARARQVELSLVRLSHLTEKLLQLSRAEAGIGFGETAIDLVPVLRVLVEDARRQAGDGERLRMSIAPGAALTRQVDADAFGITIRNLLENALIHAPPGSPVDISLDADGSIRIVNDGPVISPAELSSLARRFARGRTDAPGSGLGLQIAKRLAQQMGGRLELLSPATGRKDGFEAKLSL